MPAITLCQPVPRFLIIYPHILQWTCEDSPKECTAFSNSSSTVALLLLVEQCKYKIRQEQPSMQPSPSYELVVPINMSYSALGPGTLYTLWWITCAHLRLVPTGSVRHILSLSQCHCTLMVCCSTIATLHKAISNMMRVNTSNQFIEVITRQFTIWIQTNTLFSSPPPQCCLTD